ncbi:hypothetical protein A0H81_11511 [Grifola frondosa]|uniref:Uncharacterized protein n=1 Tax=Grifola frondosa TaxID=5627 RepID=A0A1C7LUT1_GRIFR|nr:hypothetical protein A0H81_11511 [Grifola frondosa]
MSSLNSFHHSATPLNTSMPPFASSITEKPAKSGKSAKAAAYQARLRQALVEVADHGRSNLVPALHQIPLLRPQAGPTRLLFDSPQRGQRGRDVGGSSSRTPPTIPSNAVDRSSGKADVRKQSECLRIFKPFSLGVLPLILPLILPLLACPIQRDIRLHNGEDRERLLRALGDQVYTGYQWYCQEAAECRKIPAPDRRSLCERLSYVLCWGGCRRRTQSIQTRPGNQRIQRLWERRSRDYIVAYNALITHFPCLKRMVPGLQRSVDEVEFFTDFLDTHARAARSDDLAALRYEIIDMLEDVDLPNGIKIKKFPIFVLSGDYPSYLYSEENHIEGKTLSGILEGPLLVQCYRRIFTGKSTALADPGIPRGASRKCVAAKNDMTRVTPASIAYVACLVRFCLSAQTEWCVTDGDFSYKRTTGTSSNSSTMQILRCPYSSGGIGWCSVLPLNTRFSLTARTPTSSPDTRRPPPPKCALSARHVSLPKQLPKQPSTMLPSLPHAPFSAFEDDELEYRSDQDTGPTGGYAQNSVEIGQGEEEIDELDE